MSYRRLTSILMSVRDSIIWVRLSSVGHWSSPCTTSACRKIAFRGLRISWTIFPAISPSRALRWTCHVICSKRCWSRFSLSVKALSSVWRTAGGSASSVRHWRRAASSGSCPWACSAFVMALSPPAHAIQAISYTSRIDAEERCRDAGACSAQGAYVEPPRDAIFMQRDFISGLPHTVRQDGLGVDRQRKDGRTLRGPPAMGRIRRFTGRELFSHSDCLSLIMRKSLQYTSCFPLLA